MKEINLTEAKNHLSRYIAQTQQGKSFTLCKNGEPMAVLAPLPKKQKAKGQLFGAAKGMGEILPTFFDPMTEEELPGFGL